MQKRITLQELIAFNNTPKAKSLLIRYGYAPARSYNDLINKLTIFTKEYKEDALKELAELHPHKDLILNFNLPKTSVVEEQKSNCNGNEKCDKCKSNESYLNFEDRTQMPSEVNKNQFDLKNNLSLIAITSLVTVSLVLLLKN